VAFGVETWIQLEIIDIAIIELGGGSSNSFVGIPFGKTLVLYAQVKS
jgi:hypothetical protein